MTTRPRGRPPAELTERIQVRLSAEELAAWSAAAKADGRTRSDWVRRAVIFLLASSAPSRARRR